MIKATFIKPKGKVFPRQAIERALENGLSAAARGARVDFNVTTRTWTHRPEFNIDKSPGKRKVYTDDTVYKFVSGGTKPHDIRPKNGKVLVFGGPGFKAKTSPGVIGSKKGKKGSGTIITPKVVKHPGTVARNFDKAVQKKWREQLPRIIQNAINKAVK